MEAGKVETGRMAVWAPMSVLLLLQGSDCAFVLVDLCHLWIKGLEAGSRIPGAKVRLEQTMVCVEADSRLYAP